MSTVERFNFFSLLLSLALMIKFFPSTSLLLSSPWLPPWLCATFCTLISIKLFTTIHMLTFTPYLHPFHGRFFCLFLLLFFVCLCRTFTRHIYTETHKQTHTHTYKNSNALSTAVVKKNACLVLRCLLGLANGTFLSFEDFDCVSQKLRFCSLHLNASQCHNEPKYTTLWFFVCL